MTEAIRDLPDALVLGAGGTLGEAWLRGVLNGLEAGARPRLPRLRVPARDVRGLDRRRHPGGRQAARGGRSRRARMGGGGRAVVRRTTLPPRTRASGALSRGAATAGKAVATPFAPLALATTAPAGRLARAAVLSRAPRPERTLGDLGKHIDALGPRFDGRLRIAAVDRANGRRVMFGAPDAPRANVAEAVLASCAVPWIFAPVEIGGREYVDGGVWSPTNLDAVPAGRGSRVLCLIPTAGATLAPLRTVSSAAAGYESMALRARGAEVRTIVPDDASLAAIGPDLMDPSRRAGRRRGLRAGPGSALGRRARRQDLRVSRPSAARPGPTATRAVLRRSVQILLIPRAARRSRRSSSPPARPSRPPPTLRRPAPGSPGSVTTSTRARAPRPARRSPARSARPRPAARSTRSTPARLRRGDDHEGDHDRRRATSNGGILIKSGRAASSSTPASTTTVMLRGLDINGLNRRPPPCAMPRRRGVRVLQAGAVRIEDCRIDRHAEGRSTSCPRNAVEVFVNRVDISNNCCARDHRRADRRRLGQTVTIQDSTISNSGTALSVADQRQARG